MTDFVYKVIFLMMSFLVVAHSKSFNLFLSILNEVAILYQCLPFWSSIFIEGCVRINTDIISLIRKKQKTAILL